MTTRLTIRDLEARISYPPPVKRQPYCEPVSSKASRTLLKEYRASVANIVRRAMFASNAQAARPSSASTLLSQYERAVAEKRNEDAMGYLLEAIRSGETSHDVLFNVALLKHEAGAYAEAVDYYTKALQKDPMRHENYLNRAECFMALDDPLSAFVEWEKYFKLAPATKQLYVKCGKCALDCDRLDAAEYYLRQVLADPSPDAATDAYAYFNLGELKERQRDAPGAKEMFAMVCATQPAFPQPYIEQADQEFAQGKFDMALHLYEAVAKMLPASPEIFVKLADVYERLGEEFTASVLDCLSRAIELNSSDSNEQEKALARRGILYFEKFGDLARAESDFTFCLAINPRNADSLLYRALVYRHRNGDGDHAAAVNDYVELLLLPEVSWAVKADPHRFLAHASFDEGDYARCVRYFAFAGAEGCMDANDHLTMLAATAKLGMAFDGLDEAYDPRPGFVPKESEKSKKQVVEVVKPFPLPSLSYQLVDSAYNTLRDLEPTAHCALEGTFLNDWRPIKEELERRRDEHELTRAGKRPQKKK